LDPYPEYSPESYAFTRRRVLRELALTAEAVNPGLDGALSALQALM
jgi:hypothetical protein